MRRSSFPAAVWWVIAANVGAVAGLAIRSFRTAAPDRWNIAAALVFVVVLGLVVASGRVDFDTGTVRPSRAHQRRTAGGILGLPASGAGSADDARVDRAVEDVHRRDDRVLPALRHGDGRARSPRPR